MSDNITIEHINNAVPPEEFAKGSAAGAFGTSGYNNAAYHACKILLQIATRDPVGFKAALDAYRANFSDEMQELMTPEERALIMDGRYGITGFQWGWALNTAAYFTEQAPVPNGAIISF